MVCNFTCRTFGYSCWIQDLSYLVPGKSCLDGCTLHHNKVPSHIFVLDSDENSEPENLAVFLLRTATGLPPCVIELQPAFLVADVKCVKWQKDSWASAALLLTVLSALDLYVLIFSWSPWIFLEYYDCRWSAWTMISLCLQRCFAPLIQFDDALASHVPS